MCTTGIIRPRSKLQRRAFHRSSLKPRPATNSLDLHVLRKGVGSAGALFLFSTVTRLQQFGTDGETNEDSFFIQPIELRAAYLGFSSHIPDIRIAFACDRPSSGSRTGDPHGGAC